MTRTPIKLSSMVLLALLLAVGGGLAILFTVDGERARTAHESAPESLAPSAPASSPQLDAPRVLDLTNVAETRRSARQSIAADSRTSLSLAAGEGLALHGTVIELDGGEPIAGAIVAAGDESFVVESESDAHGLFELLVPADNTLALAIRCAGYAPVSRPPGSPGEALVIELEREGRIAGTLEGPAREVAEGAQVLLFRMNQGAAGRVSIAETAVDTEGAFGFGELGAGEYQLCVAVEGFGFEFAHGLQVRCAEVREVVLRPSVGGVLRGLVLYSDSGDPVVGATVSALPAVQGLAKVVRELAELSTETGPEGQYELRGLAPGEADLKVETEWGGRLRDVVVIGEAAEEVERDFTLNAPASLSGRVLTDGGQGAASAHVKVTWEGLKSITEHAPDAEQEQDFGTSRVLIASTDINGLYTFPQLPAGRNLHMFAFRGPQATQEVLQADERAPVRAVKLKSAEERLNFDVQLEPLASLAGIVRDPSGQRIAHADLRVAYKRSGGKAMLYQSILESDADGAFEIVGILPGRYDLFAEADEHQKRRVNIEVPTPPARGAALEVILEPAERLHGYVVDERGYGLAQASVTATPEDARNGRFKFQARADDNGHFELSGLPPGRFKLLAKAFQYRMDNGSSVSVESGAAAPVIIELAPSPVEDRCTIAGRITASDRGDLQGLEVSSLRAGVFRRDGLRFELQGVRSGLVHLNFSAPGYLRVKLEPLKLQPGMFTDIGLIEMHPAAKLEIFVRNKNGKSAHNASVKLTLVRPGGYGQPAPNVPLPGKTSKHRWGGKGKLRKVQAWHSEQVPFATWRLDVREAGHLPWSRELVFDASHREKRVEVLLKNDPEAAKRVRKNARKRARAEKGKK